MATETWVLNDTINDGETDMQNQWNVDFISAGISYKALNMYIFSDDDENYMIYKPNLSSSFADSTLVYDRGTWMNQAYRTITFAQPVTDATLLNWLQQNGTKQGGGGRNYD